MQTEHWLLPVFESEDQSVGRLNRKRRFKECRVNGDGRRDAELRCTTNKHEIAYDKGHNFHHHNCLNIGLSLAKKGGRQAEH